jgi:hypothetical protein
MQPTCVYMPESLAIYSAQKNARQVTSTAYEYVYEYARDEYA